MTLKETLKYMESQVHLQEATVNGVNEVLNYQGLTNEIKISQGKGQNIVINGKEYPESTGNEALDIILKKTHPDYNKGLDKNQVLQNVINSLSDIDNGNISNSIKQNMNLPQQANSSQNLPANQGQNQIVVKKNGKVITPTSDDIKAIQDSIQNNGLEQTQQIYKQRGFDIEFTPPTQITDGTNGQNSSNVTGETNQNNLPAIVTPQEIQAVEEELTKVEAEPITPLPDVNYNGLSDEDLEKQIAEQSKKAQEYLDRISYLTDLANRLLKDPKLAEASNKNKKIKQKLGGNGFLKGLLNTAAGVVGNFIGGIASGMGAAK